MSNHYDPEYDSRERLNDVRELTDVALAMVKRHATVDQIEKYTKDIGEPSAVLLYALIAYFRMTNA